MSILSDINSPKDIKKMNMVDLKILAKEIRQVILDTVLTNGGHLASSLGVVEVIIAMHYVFDAPFDKLIFDVGHQCLAHKLLTGRYKNIDSLRKMGGLSGFPKRDESVYDTLNTGHSSTSLSVACGISRALELDKSNNIAVSLIGDGALTGGLAYEALNDCDEIKHKQVVILNDNSMSISPNVGGTAKYLLKLHGNNVYQKIKNGALSVVKDLKVTDKSVKLLYNLKNSIKYLLQGGMPFEQFGLRYFGPINGHNLDDLIKAFTIAKKDEDSVIIHVVTKKGKGYLEAEENPSKYHGYSPKSGSAPCESFSNAFGGAMVELAKKNNKIFAITAAMVEGVGLLEYSNLFPERFADVGIAEAHATTTAVGLAISGYKPYFAVYSSFLQRAFDQIIHDVCLQNLPVTFCIDRAGIVPSDGETHQGVYDTNFLRLIPNMTIVNPKSCEELKKVMDWSEKFNSPLAIRYPKGSVNYNDSISDISLGVWEVLKDNKSDVVVLATGAKMVEVALQAYQILLDDDVKIDIVNALFVKPLDETYLKSLSGKKVITLEDNMYAGGFGSAVLEFVNRHSLKLNLEVMAIDNIILEHASVKELQKIASLDANAVVLRVKKLL